MIKINRIVPQNWEAFDPNDKSLGFLNVFECNDLRIQIKEHKAIGYYLIFKDPEMKVDRRIEIKPNGKMYDWPNGFFDMHETQLRKLLEC